MKKIFTFASALSLTLLPAIAFAAGTDNSAVGKLISKVGVWVSSLVPIMMGVAVLYFIYGVISFISVSDAEKKGEARTVMINGLIGVVCILGLYGISAALLSTVGATDTSALGGSNTGTIPGF